MNLKWESNSTEVFINPKIAAKEEIEQKLLSLGLKGHIWISTSGSSCSKWVALSKKGILCSAEEVNANIAADHQDIWIHAIPDFHIGGLSIWARAFLSESAVIDFKAKQKWDPYKFKDCAKAGSATIASLVPTQVYDLVSKQIEAPESLRVVFVGGGALEENLSDRANLLGWKLLPTYGSTECSSQVATGQSFLEILSHVNAKTDHEGKLMLKSKSLFTAYGIIDGEVRLFDPKVDGWYTTEDRVEIDGRTLKVLGRIGDMIKIGGESVSLSSLEKVAESIKLELGISQDFALMALPDERLGKSIHLVATHESLRLLYFIEEYQKRVLPFERIRGIQFVATIPRNEVGKLKRRELEDAIISYQ